MLVRSCQVDRVDLNEWAPIQAVRTEGIASRGRPDILSVELQRWPFSNCIFWMYLHFNREPATEGSAI